MYNALTLYFTDDEDWQPQVCQVMMPNGQSRAVSTWAPFLVGNQVYDDFRAYSVELRSLVARCMADNRRDRPSLDELLNVIQRNIRRGDLDAEEAKNRWEEEKAADPDKQKPPVDIKRPPRVEDDALLLRFFREYIRDPPRRDDPYEDLWDQ
ncbi:hypothetical protein F4781DRAFT_50856 [Annulohypoxylon bovei var. microspora]|nr:hypothetical protein F4781DRAFT_50856 [Annulohypoxylon bovei var. microspora]